MAESEDEMTNDRFNRTYVIEIEFDTPFDFAEQDRLACVMLEKLVDEFWSDAAASTRQGNMPIKTVAYPMDCSHRS